MGACWGYDEGLGFLIAGVLVAKRLVQRIDALMLRRIVCVLMLINGVVLIAR